MSAAIPDRPTVLDATLLSNVAYLGHVDHLEVLARLVTREAVRDLAVLAQFGGFDVGAGLEVVLSGGSVATASKETGAFTADPISYLSMLLMAG